MTPGVHIQRVPISAFAPFYLMLRALHQCTAWISIDEGNAMFRIANKYASVRACLTILQQFVFQFDVQCSYAKLSTNVLSTLAKRIMRDAIVLGFSVVRVRIGKDPEHLPWGTYRIGVMQKEFKQHFVVQHLQSGDNIFGAVVLTGFNADPGIDGTINSIMAAVRQKTIIIAQLADCYITAEKNRSCPTTFIEQDTSATNAREEPSWDFYADASADAVEHDEHNSFMRDKFSLRRLDAIENNFDDGLERGVGFMGNALNDAEGTKRESTRLANRHAALASIAPVPSGYKMSSQPQPSHAPAGVVNTFQFFEQEIYALLQIPRSMVHQDHERAKVDEQAMQRQLMQTVHSWQNMLTRALNYIVITSSDRKRKRRSDTNINVTQNMVQFQRVPVASTDDLYMAYSNSVLSFPAMQELVLAKLGLPAEMADKAAEAPERAPSWSNSKSKRSASEEPLSRSRPEHKSF